MLITPEYCAQQQAFHDQRPDYGCSGQNYVDIVLQFAERLHTRDILDYGCGKQTLQKSIPFRIQNYDPAVPDFAKPPVPADIVVCTDVLEHIEADCVIDVLDDIARLTRKLLFLQVATGPAVKVLQDGRNAHILQRPASWWLPLLMSRLDLQSFQANKASFCCLFMPNQPPMESSDAQAA